MCQTAFGGDGEMGVAIEDGAQRHAGGVIVLAGGDADGALSDGGEEVLHAEDGGGAMALALGVTAAIRLLAGGDVSELDLPFGSLRCKLGGGDNGHNGLKSLRRSLGTGDFFRVRVGIGRPPGRP